MGTQPIRNAKQHAAAFGDRHTGPRGKCVAGGGDCQVNVTLSATPNLTDRLACRGIHHGEALTRRSLDLATANPKGPGSANWCGRRFHRPSPGGRTMFARDFSPWIAPLINPPPGGRTNTSGSNFVC
jgi:hypothetical protein